MQKTKTLRGKCKLMNNANQYYEPRWKSGKATQQVRRDQHLAIDTRRRSAEGYTAEFQETGSHILEPGQAHILNSSFVGVWGRFLG